MLAARIRSISAQCILHRHVRKDPVGQISRIILEATIMTITTQLEDTSGALREKLRVGFILKLKA